jgi:hypothetical protein
VGPDGGRETPNRVRGVKEPDRRPTSRRRLREDKEHWIPPYCILETTSTTFQPKTKAVCRLQPSMNDHL